MLDLTGCSGQIINIIATKYIKVRKMQRHLLLYPREKWAALPDNTTNPHKIILPYRRNIILIYRRINTG